MITDRVILRQVLISLFKDILNNNLCTSLTVSFKTTDTHVGIELITTSAPQGTPPDGEDLEDEITAVKYWCERIHARVEESIEQSRKNVIINRVLCLPQPVQKIMLVIDDQDAVVNLFQRYLSQTDVLIIGVSDPEKAVSAGTAFSTCADHPGCDDAANGWLGAAATNQIG